MEHIFILGKTTQRTRKNENKASTQKYKRSAPPIARRLILFFYHYNYYLVNEIAYSLVECLNIKKA